MRAPLTTGISGSLRDIGTSGVLRAMARSLILKLTVGCFLTFVFVDVCFDMNGYNESGFRAMFQGPFMAGIKAAAMAKGQIAPTGNQSHAVTGVPEDVLSDSLRTNLSAPRLCPPISPNLVGYVPTEMNVPSLEAVEDQFPDVMPGGHFRPKECTSRHRVAILIPYRNRAEHLKIFIYNIHRVLARQQIDYGVFVIEQGDTKEFNRAKLLNIGFLQSTALYDYQCFVFHDIDLVPVDDRNVYTCPQQPRHMSVLIDHRSGRDGSCFT